MKRLLMCLLALSCIFVCSDSFAAKESKDKSQKTEKAKKSKKAQKSKAVKGSAVWNTDLKKALAEAKTTKKPIMLLITGSTWCGPCKYLEKNVFSSKEFARYARRSLVLLKADIPAGGKNMPETTKDIIKKYPSNGVPTVYVLSSSGTVLDKQVGAQDGNNFKTYIKRFKSLKK